MESLTDLENKKRDYSKQINQMVAKRKIFNIDVEKYNYFIAEMEQWVNILSLFKANESGDKCLEIHERLKFAETQHISNYSLKAKILAHHKKLLVIQTTRN